MAAATSIKLDEALKGRVRHLADARRRSSHWIMREAIAQYVEREEKREAFRQEAMRAWEEYQRAGLHATLEEADAWLAKLEASEDAKPPKCHV
jgi:predicted transcriptional regulator